KIDSDAGTAKVTGTQDINARSGAKLDIAGTLDLQTNATLANPANDAGTTTITGTLKKTTVASGTTAINVPVANSGTLDVQAGDVSLNADSGAQTSTGTWQAASGSTIIDAGTLKLGVAAPF